MEVKDALEMLEDYQSYWRDIYKVAKTDLEFRVGIGHWDEKVKIEREAAGRPCYIIDQINQFIHQVMNDERQNTPSINVIPAGEGSDMETAKILKGLIRQIEYASGADEIYDTAGEYAVSCGIGFLRVDHQYCDDDSGYQELVIKRVQNPLSVWIDPSSTECDGRDAEGAIILDTISRKEFKKLYGEKNFISFEQNKNNDKNYKNNEDRETITIAEIFTKKIDETEDSEGKKTRKSTIKRYKFSGADLLEETNFVGKYIPVIPVFGEEIWIDGKRHLLSLIRGALDAQRRYNILMSKNAEVLMQAPIAPIMADAGSVEEYAESWKNPNKSNVLLYNSKDKSGMPLNMPTRLNPPTESSGFTQAAIMARDDIKAAMGLYNSSLGQKSNETSGVAIQRRQQEGDTATFHFGDNRNRAITQCGRVLISAIPETYDTARILQIIGEEETPQFIAVNGAPLANGQTQKHDIRIGKYDVRVTTGASYTTKRQEAAQLLSDLVKTTPELMGVVGDLLFKNMDIAGADAIAQRIKKTIPKELLADEEAKRNGQQSPDPEKIQMQQALEQLQAQLQQMTSELQSKHGDIQTKVMEQENKQRELDLKEKQIELDARISFENIKTDRMKIEIDAFKAHKNFEPEMPQGELEQPIGEAQAPYEITSNGEMLAG